MEEFFESLSEIKEPKGFTQSMDIEGSNDFIIIAYSNEGELWAVSHVAVEGDR